MLGRLRCRGPASRFPMLAFKPWEGGFIRGEHTLGSDPLSPGTDSWISINTEVRIVFKTQSLLKRILQTK